MSEFKGLLSTQRDFYFHFFPLSSCFILKWRYIPGQKRRHKISDISDEDETMKRKRKRLNEHLHPYSSFYQSCNNEKKSTSSARKQTKQKKYILNVLCRCTQAREERKKGSRRDFGSKERKLNFHFNDRLNMQTDRS
jgi:hypothetical protein